MLENLNYPTNTKIFDKFELTFELPRVAERNPYDPAEIEVFAEISSGERVWNILGFYFEEFAISGFRREEDESLAP